MKTRPTTAGSSGGSSQALGTLFYGAGQSGSVETTALAAWPSARPAASPATRGAPWPGSVAQKDARRHLALDAGDRAGAQGPAGRHRSPARASARRRLALNGKVSQILIPADQAEVVKQVDLSKHLPSGQQTLT